jgi:acyl carrier protein
MLINLQRSVTRTADPVALRKELELREPIDIRSPDFERFVIRLSERMDFDIPREDYPKLATLSGCSEYVSQLRAAT